MIVKVLRALIALAFVSGSLAISPAAVSTMSQGSPTAAKLAPVAIGSAPLTKAHLRAPREDIVLQTLQEQGVIKDGASQEEVKAALKTYYTAFSKRSYDWIAPDVEAFDLKREADLSSTRAKTNISVQPVTANVFALAVQFGTTEVYTEPCISPAPFTIKGPMQGEVAFPDAGDNNTLWYSPTQTADVSFYNNLIFGHTGVGRVRYDLTDPEDGKPGINLDGLTVQDYYDGVAGIGNVTISGVVTGWVTVPHSEGYYGAPIYTGTPPDCNYLNQDGGVAQVGKVVVDALEAFKTEHPGYFTDTSPNAFWKQFDKNMDGILDAMWILHAGADEAAGGGAEGEFAIWSHSWALSAQGLGEYKVYEGDPGTTDDDIYVDPYTVQPENADLGVLVEEFGHNFFNLPDLYTTDVSNSVGDWSEMSGGSWMGWVGGTKPVGMPLWFRMVAAFRGAGGALTPLNWQNPMDVRSYDSPPATLDIGNLERTNTSDLRSKGVRVNLPDSETTMANLAGTGKGAWAESTNDTTRTLSHKFSLSSSTSHTLSIDMFWDTEPDYDYAYVEVNGVLIKDKTGFMTNFNPNGGNPGWALTGAPSDGKPHTLEFDLSAYKGQTVDVSILYTCDPGTTFPGVWLDNVTLDGTLVDDFELASGSSFPGWTNDGWATVPFTKMSLSYYLVEWRTKTKYDQMVKTAYVTTDSDVNLWRVERVPYNIPGALVYYRDARYGESYSQFDWYGDPPSMGPKNKLLVVDMNYWPLRISPLSTKSLTGRASSYDSALTLHATQPFTLTKVYGVSSPAGPYTFASKPPITSFSDGLGKYAGFLYPGSGNTIYFAARDDSVVIPARTPYSTRISHMDFTPYPTLYEDPILDPYSWWLGTGNPGDFDAQFGTNFELLGKTGDDAYNSTASLSFGWAKKPYEVLYSPDEITTLGDHQIMYQLVMNNAGTLDQTRTFSVTLDPNLTLDTLLFGIGDFLGPSPAMAKVESGKYGWSFVLPPNKTAIVEVIANVDVQDQATTFTTVFTHSDGVNPANDVSIPMVTLNHAIEWINHFFPIMSH